MLCTSQEGKKISVIDEVEEALANKTYETALTLALTIPDIYGKISYPELGNRTKKRYVKWFQENVGEFLGFTDDDCPEFDGESCYRLRCKMLHEANSKLTLSELSGYDPHVYNNNNTKVRLCIGICSSWGKRWANEDEDNARYSIDISVEELCKELCDAARRYEFSHQDDIKNMVMPWIDIYDASERVAFLKKYQTITLPA